MTAFYNEIDPFAAAWLRELIAAGHIAPGVVDERDIRDIRPDDLAGYTQCHFFAGIGVWSYALRRAGWPDDRPIWTGSCPCQPFSEAGSGQGFADERHLWPAFYHLATHCRPPVLLGEQVASKSGLGWFDLVQSDMEAAAYAGGAFDLCAAGVGSPHRRQRLFFAWVDDTPSARPHRAIEQPKGNSRHETRMRLPRPRCEAGGMAEPDCWECDGIADGKGCLGYREESGWIEGDCCAQSDCAACGVADRDGERQPRRPQSNVGQVKPEQPASRRADALRRSDATRAGPVNGFWRNADWLGCRDDKWRPVEPGTFPLADGSPARVGRLRGYGNAINAEVATAFIEAVMGELDERASPTRLNAGEAA